MSGDKLVPAQISRNEVISLVFRLTLFGALTYFGVRWMVKAIDPTRKQKVDAQKRAERILNRIGVKNVRLSEYELSIAARFVDPATINISWEDFAGLEDIIQEIRETVILPIQKRGLLSGSMLIQPPKGVLLHGSPGCSKTMIAKATAKEAGARFINLEVSSLTDKWYGESQKLAAAVFTLAIKIQPCIIFIDEIDSFLRSRDTFDHEATAMMKAQFMSLWDGLITDPECQVIVMGATNRPQDVDRAILRRMPSMFHIALPKNPATGHISGESNGSKCRQAWDVFPSSNRNKRLTEEEVLQIQSELKICFQQTRYMFPVMHENDSLEYSDTEMLNCEEKEQAQTVQEQCTIMCTGVSTVPNYSRNIRIEDFYMNFHAVEILADSKLELNCGRRYGLIGLNGCGKSALLAALSCRKVPIPTHIDICYLTREMEASEKSALQTVIDVDVERTRLQVLSRELAQYYDDESQEQLMDIYERLDEIGAEKAQAKAAYILHGLGFSKDMQQKMCKDFSGGWRMRIALARALYVRPHLLLLDEPTNHLDLEACVWLEEELKTYKRILVVISHSQDFLNGVCTNIIHIDKKALNYYGGNYDTFVRTRLELLGNEMKHYSLEQSQIAHMKVVQFSFPDCGTIPSPVITVHNVSFRYKDDGPWIYKNLEFGIDLDSRIALVGPNGAGKSTLLKLLCGECVPSDGLVRAYTHIRFGRYQQHLIDVLNMDVSALEYMKISFPHITEEEIKKSINHFGLTGRQQICAVWQLSDGQRCRLSLAWLSLNRPHFLFLEEPTNHLDLVAQDALIKGIKEFSGGMVLVSHNLSFISQVAREIWVCQNGTITKWLGTIHSYKDHISKRVLEDMKKAL